MRALTSLQALSAVAAIALLVGCSGGSAIGPQPVSPHGDANSAETRVSTALRLMGFPTVNSKTSPHFKTFYACPAKGSIKYVSDFNASVIDVFVGKFAGQAPCGQITSGLVNPIGLYVKAGTHDLYVANTMGFNVLVFHRGQTTPYNTYTDPSVQQVGDVTVAKDGTVIAVNVQQKPNGFEKGSISTWIGGPNGGTFVGNFPLAHHSYGRNITVRKNGTVYYDDVDAKTGKGALWSLSCPAGACGAQTHVAGVSFNLPSGLVFDAEGDLLVNDSGTSTAETFELPNPNPKTFPLIGRPLGMAINELEHHWYVTDPVDNDASEYSYPSGKLIGTVSGTSGAKFGIAVDP
jgi:hypothetical protein